MSVNKNTASLEEVEEDLEELSDDIEEVTESLEEVEEGGTMSSPAPVSDG